MTNLLSPEQIAARARARRVRLSSDYSDNGSAPWAITVEGWRDGRQVFATALDSTDQIESVIGLARSVLNADTVVVFSDSRILQGDTKDPEYRALLERFRRDDGLTLLDLARAGNPHVMDQITAVPFSIERGIFDAQMLRYVTRYAFNREVSLVWDSDHNHELAADGSTLAGFVPDSLERAMREFGYDANGDTFLVADGGTLAWERLDAPMLARLAGVLEAVSHGRFVILNSDARITEAARLRPGSAPGRIAVGNREPEAIAQLVAREVALPQ